MNILQIKSGKVDIRIYNGSLRTIGNGYGVSADFYSSHGG